MSTLDRGAPAAGAAPGAGARAGAPSAVAPGPLTLAGHAGALAQGRFVRVMNYHNTPPSRRDQLRAELAALAERYRPWTLADLDTMMATGAWPGDRPGLLAVFYEGYRSSASVAAPVCEELGITGWFMVCTGFVDCPAGEQELFARSHRIGLVPEDLAGGRLAMSWDDVAQLSARHVVTPHTASHAGIEEVASEADLEREVLEPKRRMDAVTGQSAPAFAWLHGSPFGLSTRHDSAVRDAGYRYLVANTTLHRL